MVNPYSAHYPNVMANHNVVSAKASFSMSVEGQNMQSETLLECTETLCGSFVSKSQFCQFL